MTTEIIVDVFACTHKTLDHDPVTTTYFTFVSNDLYPFNIPSYCKVNLLYRSRYIILFASTSIQTNMGVKD